MSSTCSWARGGLRTSHSKGQPVPTQLRSIAPGMLPLSRGSRIARSIAPSRNSSSLMVCASSATALDADCSLGIRAEPGPIGQLGFSTTMQKNFYTLGGRHLGSGAYGVVSMVVDRRTGVEYACKALPKTRGALTPAKTAKKIWKEINILSRLQQCSNVARLVAVYEDDARVYIIQELCQGGDLDALVTEHGPFSERQAALVLYECLRVIATCHAAGVVHGDVKPANFLLKQRLRNPLPLIEAGTVTEWLKAIDFGCSQESRGSQFTRRTGTPVYMAPEVFLREYNQSADMWSLGMMLYQFMTCRLPFWETMGACKEQSLDDVAKSVCRGAVGLDYGPFRHMSAEGLDLLRSLTDKDPVHRATAAEAMSHPWFRKMRDQPPTVTCSNVVPLKGPKHAAPAPPRARPQAQTRRQRQTAAAPAAAQKSVMRVGRSYPSPAAVVTFAY